MKVVIAVAALALSTVAFADQYVQPHVTRNGTYVEGHYRSEPNSNRYDNYSSQGNTNPYTGQRGTERNEYSNPPAYNQQNNPYGNTYQNPYDTNRRR